MFKMIDTLSSLYFFTSPLYEFTPYDLIEPFETDEQEAFLYLGNEVRRGRMLESTLKLGFCYGTSLID